MRYAAAIGLLCFAAGCAPRMFVDFGGDRNIPAESVNAYAKAHGLSRAEAIRELGMLQDAKDLKELRQAEKQAAGDAPPDASLEAPANPETAPRSAP